MKSELKGSGPNFEIWLSSSKLLLLKTLLFIVFLAPDLWVERLWAGESKHRILIAFVAIFFKQQVWSMIAQIAT